MAPRYVSMEPRGRQPTATMPRAKPRLRYVLRAALRLGQLTHRVTAQKIQGEWWLTRPVTRIVQRLSCQFPVEP